MNKIIFAFGIFLLFGFFGDNSVNAACGEGAIPSFTNSSICYWFVGPPLAFIEAELNCEASGGHLASVSDGFTNTLLAQHAKKVLPDATDFWIGGEDLGKKDYWYWVDGTNFTFTNWAPEEPVELPGFDCMGVTVAEGFWYTYDCFKLKPYVCELPSSSSPPATITAAPQTTPLNVNTTTFMPQTTLIVNVPTTTQSPPTFLPSSPSSSPSFMDSTITSSSSPDVFPSTTSGAYYCPNGTYNSGLCNNCLNIPGGKCDGTLCCVCSNSGTFTDRGPCIGGDCPDVSSGTTSEATASTASSASSPPPTPF